MNSSATRARGLAAAAVAALLASAGCGTPVDEVRVEALDELAAMQYWQGRDELAERVEAAEDAAQIERWMEEARRGEEAAADTFWGCVAPAARLVGRSVWSTQVVDEKQTMSVLELRLAEDGSASLERSATTARIGFQEPAEGERWLLDRVGAVHGWESRLAEQVENRDLAGAEVRVNDASTCTLPFELRLKTDDGEAAQEALLVRGKGGVALRMLELPFDPVEETD